MRSGKSIRRQLFTMLAVPIAALVGLYAFALASTVAPVLELNRSTITDRDVHVPGDAAVAALQAERKATQLFLAGGRRDSAPLLQARTTTDDTVGTFRRLLNGSALRDGADPETTRTIKVANQTLDGLAAGRQTVDGGGDRTAAQTLYTDIITAVYDVYESLTESVTPQVTEDANGKVAMARVRELLRQQDALVSGMLAAGRYSPADAASLVSLVGSLAAEYRQSARLLDEELRARLDEVFATETVKQLVAIELSIPARSQVGGPIPLDPAAWQAAYAAVETQIEEFIKLVDERIDEHATDAARAVQLKLAVTGLGGLAAVVFSLLLAVRLGRSLARRLAGLQASALDLAEVRLPRVVARLREGEQVDVRAEAPLLDLGDDEIGRVGEAFNRVQHTAVQSAVEEAKLREGINQFFVNIARRSQGLLHRQLALLDAMERRTTEPAELADLFAVDHLATRMRRHAEDLVILAGAAPSRGWRNPVPMVDVIRGAISEIEDYARVNLAGVGDAALTGRAVGDVVHLLAELIENGAVFSPPNTHVTVSGQLVANGFAVEIEDRGLGMTPADLAVTNGRLLEPPDFNLANSAQLGLFVVARLAAKHGVRVQLRPSLFGGVTAVVLIPKELVTTVEAARHGPDPSDTQQLPVLRRPGILRGAHRRGVEAEPTPAQRPASPAGAAAPVPAAPVADVPTGPPSFEVPLRTRPRMPAAGARPGGLPSPEAPALTPAPAPLPAPVPLSPIRLVPPVAAEPADRPDRSAPVATVPTQAGPPRSAPAPGDSPDRPRHLPKRVRQASLAPQLRKSDGPAALDGHDTPAGRSPEEIRARMSSFQTGTTRGRAAGSERAAGLAGSERAAGLAGSERAAGLAGSERAAGLAGSEREESQ
jgi:hypothetical protein